MGACPPVWKNWRGMKLMLERLWREFACVPCRWAAAAVVGWMCWTFYCWEHSRRRRAVVVIGGRHGHGHGGRDFIVGFVCGCSSASGTLVAMTNAPSRHFAHLYRRTLARLSSRHFRHTRVLSPHSLAVAALPLPWPWPWRPTPTPGLPPLSHTQPQSLALEINKYNHQ